MRIQLDTTNKTIKLEDGVNLKEFFSKVQQILPNGEWEDFTLETNTTIQQWANPIIIKEYPSPYQPVYRYPWYTTTSGRKDYVLCKGEYKVEC